MKMMNLDRKLSLTLAKGIADDAGNGKGRRLLLLERLADA
jgi:hypothetical protein